MPSCPWDSPSKNTGMGCHFLLQGIFPTQVSRTAGRFFTIWATFKIFETCIVFIVPNIRRNTFLIKHSYPPHQSGLSLSDWMNHGVREGGHVKDSPLDFKGGVFPEAEKLGRPRCPSPLRLPCFHNLDNSEDCCRGGHSGSKGLCHLEEPHDQQEVKPGLASLCPFLLVSPLPHTALWLYCCYFKPTVAPRKLILLPKTTSKVPLDTAISRYRHFLSAGVRFPSESDFSFILTASRQSLPSSCACHLHACSGLIVWHPDDDPGSFPSQSILHTAAC